MAITAVVLGGVVLGGGRGWIVAAVAGAFALESLLMLLNFAGVPSTMRDAVQGVIIIAAVAYSATSFRAKRRSRPTETPLAEEKEAVPPGSAPQPAKHHTHALRDDTAPSVRIVEGTNPHNQGGL